MHTEPESVAPVHPPSALPVSSAAPEGDVLPELDSIRAGLAGWAASHGLRLLRAVLTGHYAVCEISPVAMSAEDFLALAAHVNAPFVYYNDDLFDAAQFGPEEETLALMDVRDRKKVTALQGRAREQHGRCRTLVLQFAAGAVVHSWHADALWWQELAGELDEVEENPHEEEQEAREEDPPSTPEEIDRIARHLEELPAFREATKRAERERILLREFPELRSRRYNGLSRLGYDAGEEATARVAEAAKHMYDGFTANLPDLAQEAADQGVLAQATTAAARRAALRAFAKERSGGYPPSKDFVELLYSEPALKKPR
ncbi:hypothetical protein FGW37_33165 [Streptomyces rectiverticillatus]|uniref:hypothetical protein n=1 Tax=Streptomyces rectiverticillatus TaxID=173860 RepID=UPI0015C3F2EE|nr:hypothetical protein [Streptomyces rectiverticillatus]QLE70217.1 hypothetical protein FGW37_00010 [Streptomyces rectiverticillatus]QLE75783.1 hypothetical protein FGW37_33165 [Streptomyces rectiverticillatus]